MAEPSSRRRFIACGSATLALSAAAVARVPAARAQGVPMIKVMTFPGITNFPIFVAQDKGLFAKHGIAIELLYTPNSQVQRDGLAKGDHQIIQTAADNP